MQPFRRQTVAVIGAGPAGLAAALEAQAAGFEVILLEKMDRPGGKGGSRRWGDFIVDFGPHAFHAMSKKITEIIASHGGTELSEVKISQRLYVTDVPMKYPFSFQEGIRTFGLLLNVRIFLDYLFVKIKATIYRPRLDSFRAYGIANFGRTLYDICFGLYSERVWGCSADLLSVEFARRKLPSVSLGAFLLEAFSRNRPSKTNTKSYLHIRRYLYPKYGMGAVYENIAAALVKNGAIIHYGFDLSMLQTDSSQKVLSATAHDSSRKAIQADLFVSTIPISDLLASLDSGKHKSNGPEFDLPFRNGVIVNAVVKRKQFDTCHWMYLVNHKFYFGRVSEPKNFSSACAPSHQTLLMFEKICSSEDAAWSRTPEEWRPFVVTELDHFGVAAGEIGAISVSRMDKAFPFHLVGYEKRKTFVLEQLSGFANLVTTGRYGLYLDINMHDSMVLGVESFRHLQDGRVAEFYQKHEEIPLAWRDEN